MPCKNGKCEYKPPLNRRLENPPTPEEIRYAQLWEEIELPKLLRQRGLLKETLKEKKRNEE